MDMVSRIQKDMAILREENRLLRTPAASQVVQAPRQAALTTTKVPRPAHVFMFSCFQSSARPMMDPNIINHADVNDDIDTDLPERVQLR